VLGVCFSKLPA